MASIGSIRLNTTSYFVVDQHPLLPNRFLSTPASLIRTPSSQKALAASIALSDLATYSPLFKHQENPQLFQEKDSVFPDNLDSWVRDSVVEIVKNLKKAPLLVHVYSNKNGEIMEVKTEEGVAENWPNIKKQWRFGETKCPDGIILVEELQDDDKEFEINSDGTEEGGETKAWGVLIQGRMAEESQREYNRPSCYLLKTCRVNSGLGFFGTHFSLIRVNGFKESAFSQIKNSWLLR